MTRTYPRYIIHKVDSHATDRVCTRVVMMLRMVLRRVLRAGGLLALALLEGPGGGVDLEEGDALLHDVTHDVTQN
eukprot:6883169-Pyramimonas_sp.AAC.1